MKESKELTTIWQGFAVWVLLAIVALIIWALLTVVLYYFFADSISFMWYLLGAGLLSLGIVAVFAKKLK